MAYGSNPSSIFAHTLDYLKGFWDGHHVDCSGKIDTSNVDPSAQPVNAGRCVHVSSAAAVPNALGRVDLLFQPGAVGTQMPMYLIKGQNAYDVSNPGYGQTDPYGYTAITPTGVQTALVAIGGFELSSTEFDTTAGVVFNVNDALHSPVQDQITGGNYATAGLLYNYRNWPGGNGAKVTAYTDHVCGIVSRGQYTNSNRQPVISFWPCFLAGTDS